MLVKKTIQAFACAALTTLAASATALAGAPHFGPSAAACKAAQRAVEQNAATADLWNGVGQTDWLGQACMIDVMFESGEQMLQFVDARINEGLDPTVETVRSGGKDVRVNMLLSVVGRIVAQAVGGGDQPQDFVARAWTMQQAEGLQAQLEPTLFGTFANGLGITKAQAGFALDASFETAAALRGYVADAVARGVSPAPFQGKVGGKKLYIPLMLEVVGEIVPQPTATVGN